MNSINNKKIGNSFEEEFCKYLSDKGYWVHFLSPDKTGNQPFDILALKRDELSGALILVACDCKTLNKGLSFPLSRIEDNQELSFECLLKILDSGYAHNYDMYLFFAVKTYCGVYAFDSIEAIKQKRLGKKSIRLDKEEWCYKIYD